MKILHRHKWEIVYKGKIGSDNYRHIFFDTILICECGKIKKITMTKNYKIAGHTYEEVKKFFRRFSE